MGRLCTTQSRRNSRGFEGSGQVRFCWIFFGSGPLRAGRDLGRRVRQALVRGRGQGTCSVACLEDLAEASRAAISVRWPGRVLRREALPDKTLELSIGIARRPWSWDHGLARSVWGGRRSRVSRSALRGPRRVVSPGRRNPRVEVPSDPTLMDCGR